MRTLTFAHPGPKIASELIRVSLFPSFNLLARPISSGQARRNPKRQLGGSDVGLANVCHVHSLYVGCQRFLVEVSDPAARGLRLRA